MTRPPPRPLVSAAEMRAAEVASGAPGAELMRRAGEAAAALIARRWSRRRVAVICGPGANGGDGFVVAAALSAAGWPTRLSFIGSREELRGDAAAMASRWRGPFEPLTASLSDAELTVDALFGTGLNRDVSGEAEAAVNAMNAAGAPRFALDIPSGVDCDTGRLRGVAVDATLTVTFAAMKPGHVLYPGRARCGEVEVADIGVPVDARCFVNDISLWRDVYPQIDWSTHKYARGHVAVVSGPRLRTGAARLAARAALRIGAGLVTLFSPADACAENAAQLTAVMLREGASANDLTAALRDPRFTAVLIGPGAGIGAGSADTTRAILSSTARAVLDADALSSFAAEPQSLFAMLRTDDLLTPHVGEFNRLFPDVDLPAIGKLQAARAASRRAGAVILIKGADTVISAPDGRAAINTDAPPWLATAGSGDVLAGVAAGLIGQGMPTFEAACAAVWLHGAAGAHAGRGMIAEDLEGALQHVLPD